MLNQAYEIPYSKMFEFKPRYQIEGVEVEGQESQEDAIVNEDEHKLVQLMSERVH